MNWWIESTKKACTTLNYIESFLILASTITGCISISTFASLLGILIGIMSSGKGLKICAIAAGIKSQQLRKRKTSMIKLHCQQNRN